jgi:hypothetical protein
LQLNFKGHHGSERRESHLSAALKSTVGPYFLLFPTESISTSPKRVSFHLY